MDRIGTAGAQQSFHLLDCLLDHPARLVNLNLAPELDERLIWRSSSAVQGLLPRKGVRSGLP